MGHYKSNLRDIEFNLFEVFGADKALGTGPFGQLDIDSAKDLLREVERLATNDLAASTGSQPERELHDAQEDRRQTHADQYQILPAQPDQSA